MTTWTGIAMAVLSSPQRTVASVRQPAGERPVRLLTKEHEPRELDGVGPVLELLQRIDRESGDVVDVPAVDASADRRERDRGRAQFLSDLERAGETGGQQGGVGLSGMLVRANGVDHPLRS